VRLRQTLRTLKQNDAVSGSTRLAYAVDKTLRAVNDALEVYDDTQEQLTEEHKRTDEEGREVYQFRGISLIRENGSFLHADTGEEFASVDDLSQVAQRLSLELADPGAYNEAMDVLREEEANVDLHKIEEDEFFEHADISGLHAEIDLTTLETIFKDE
jgi:hypothetical protein